MEELKSIETKCYKSISCIISVLVIIFIFGAVIYDLAWTKPELRSNIKEMKTQIIEINHNINKLDSQQTISNRKFYKVLTEQQKDRYNQNNKNNKK